MKQRARAAVAVKGVRIELVLVDDAARMVTLDDPSSPAEEAAGAFARLRPPADHPPEETAAWRARVSERAIAVRVQPPPRSALVAAGVQTLEGEARRGFREVAMEVARETGAAAVEALAIEVMDEVGC